MNKQWKLYRWNTIVARVHGLQCFVLMLAIVLKLQYITPNVPYVSGTQELKITNHAMIRIDRDYDKCDDVRNSAMFKNPIKHLFPSGLMDKEHLYDFTNTSGIEYTVTTVHANTPVLICVFFALSCLFQYWNGWVLNSNPNSPRIIHYLEYSLSSSLMVVVLGVNLGVFELYQLMGLFGLFFGMNLFGACAELFCYIAEQGGMGKVRVLGFDESSLWLIPHLAGWVLFLIAYVPLFVKFCITAHCSVPELPWFLTFAVIVELFFFLLFGAVQFIGLSWRMAAVRGRGVASDKIIEAMDKWNIGLSFFAKTSLAWLLIGPALSVNTDE